MAWAAEQHKGMAATLKDEFSGDSLLELVEFRKATNKFFRENLQKKKKFHLYKTFKFRKQQVSAKERISV